MEVKLNLSNTEHKELVSYCNLNDLLVSSVVKKSFTTGFNIERYGLLGGSSEPTEIIKEVEVIKEIPVEKIVEVIEKVEIVKEVPVEKIVEVIKEVEIVKEVEVVTNIDKIRDEIRKEFSTKIQEMEQQGKEFSSERSEMENIFQNERNELLLKIQELETQKPEVVLDDTKQKMLEQTLQNLRLENVNKDRKIKELEQIVEECRKFEQKTGAVYLRGTNLDETLYK